MTLSRRRFQGEGRLCASLVQIGFLEDEESLMAAGETAGPSTSLRDGRDDTSVAGPRLFRRIYSGLYRIVIPTVA